MSRLRRLVKTLNFDTMKVFSASNFKQLVSTQDELGSVDMLHLGTGEDRKRIAYSNAFSYALDYAPKKVVKAFEMVVQLPVIVGLLNKQGEEFEVSVDVNGAVTVISWVRLATNQKFSSITIDGAGLSKWPKHLPGFILRVTAARNEGPLKEAELGIVKIAR